MDMKVNQVQQPLPVETPEQVQQTDDKFKFILTSKLEDEGLAARLNVMMQKNAMDIYFEFMQQYYLK